MSVRNRTEASTGVGGLPGLLTGEHERRVVGASEFGGLPIDEVPMGRAWRVAEMSNLSPRCAPMLATRRPRARYVASRGAGVPHGMARLGDTLYFVQGGTLYRAVDASGTGVPTVSTVGTVSDGDKQMVVCGEDLLIFPDKLYVSGADGLLRSMELETEAIAGMVFNGSTVTLPAGMRWSELGFRAGDGLHIINADDVTPAPEGHYRIREVRGREAHLYESFSASYESGAVCRREIPALERLCVMGNRVYGLAGYDIYISAEGSAFCWAGSVGTDGSGPVLLHTDTPGVLTAVAPWQGYVVFFKEDRICRLMGNRADSLSLSDLRAPGIPAELAGTLCEIGGALYYVSTGGVYRLSGSQPERVARVPADAVCLAEPGVGGCRLVGGCGGSDGVYYALSLTAMSPGAGETERRLLLYAPMRDEWLAEDDFAAVDMLEWNGILYAQAADGAIWRWAFDGREPAGGYSEAQTGAVRATVTFAPLVSDTAEGVRLSELYLRASALAGGELWVDVAYADGRSGSDAVLSAGSTVAHFTGPMQDRLLRVPLQPREADGVVVRLRMAGDWRIGRLAGVGRF